MYYHVEPMPPFTLQDFLFNDKYIKVECNFQPFDSHIYVNVGPSHIFVIVTSGFYMDRSIQKCFPQLYKECLWQSSEKKGGGVGGVGGVLCQEVATSSKPTAVAILSTVASNAESQL